MTPTQFKAWRKHMRLSQKAAGEALGLSIVAVQNYERGASAGTNSRLVSIPLHVELACAALALGVTSYAGPQQ
jgi:transcriptional regulator with XRE-family HTH domain